MENKGIFDNPLMWVMASCTLGLAPFFNADGDFEPHLFGKIKWVLGGAEGMQLMDWGDLLMHGAPFVMLAISLSLKVKSKFL